MYITTPPYQGNKINKNMTEEEQIFFEQERLWALYPRMCPSSAVNNGDDNDDGNKKDLIIYFEYLKRINAFHLALVKLQREKLLFPPK